ncbi:MAG TPA: acyl-CoA dehydrogenase [Syntrophomonadaceae bacterium]|nr:acyl-CoA dehydrogenase [Syntrophomonadaceae bacterium]
MATNYLYSIRDHQFILKEWLDLEKILNYERFQGVYTVEDVDTILTESYRAAKEVVAESNDENDTIGVIFEDGKVSVPPAMKEAYHFIQENGWGSCNSDKNYEGALPRIIYEAVLEYIFGANEGLACYYMATSGAAELIQLFGDEHLKNLFTEKMFAGTWAGTMCLTEPNAGSDVGSMASRAYPTDTSGKYRIKGTKCFITGGEQDFTENIIHLLLARVEGARPGTSGISLFAVPKYWVNEDGTLGNHNDVNCVGIENKLGMKGSSTCVMAFGENNECYGWLLGNPPDENGRAAGMAQMFHMMNGARLEMGVGSLAAAGVAYYNAAEYAKERIQGRKMTDPKKGLVSIIEHEDIRRMLLHQKAHIEAMRALVTWVNYIMDISENSPDAEERKAYRMLLDINTPITKAYNSDVSWILTGDAMQVYGGYGYSEEYPIAQLMRDVKIHSIWEGTNYIQAIDLVGRKWNIGKGQGFALWLKHIEDFIAKEKDNEFFHREITILTEALGAYKELKETLSGYALQGKVELLALYATRVLHATAQLLCGRLILEQAVIAKGKLDNLPTDHYDYPFYQGKIEAARYYIRNTVTEVANLAEKIANPDASALDIMEEAFFA